MIREHDGLLTATPGLGLAISYADCVPVVIVADGDAGPALATVHAGWRGMIAGIVGRAATELGRRGRLVAAVVGPSIGPCCFGVDEELGRRFEARFPGSAGAGTVDLWRCARQELEGAGVPAARGHRGRRLHQLRCALLLPPPRPRRHRTASGDSMAAGSVGRPEK